MFVLEETFTIFSGISDKREKWLKMNGLSNWDDLLMRGKNFFNIHEYKKIKKEIRTAKKHIQRKDIKYFFKRMDSKDHWHLYENFKEEACFLDIETTGLGNDSELTILGISDFRGRYRVFVKNINFDEKAILKFLKNFKILITFYGSRFDVPFIRNRYSKLGRFLDKMVHIDLCFLGHRVGFKGGLKAIEKQIGIKREEGIEGLTGFDAVKLWGEYKKGNKKALITLIKYNREDVINLITLAEIEIKLMKDFYS